MKNKILTFLLLATSLLLMSCSTKPVVKQNQEINSNRLEVALADVSTKISVYPYSIIRIGDTVNAMVINQQNPMELGAQISVSCSDDRSSLQYYIFPKHLYPNGGKSYTKPQSLSSEATKALKSLPKISKACEIKDDWRVISSPDKNTSSTSILIDINRAYQLENGELLVWTGYDYPTMAYDFPYQAPFSLKYEHYKINCTDKTSATLMGYDVDDKSHVTDGMMSLFPKHSAWPTDIKDSTNIVAHTVCEHPSSLLTAPPFIPSQKSFPNTTKLEELSPSVLKEVMAQDLLKPKKQISQYKTIGTSTYEGKTTPLAITREISPTATNGIWKVKEKGNGYTAESLSFLGLIPMSSIAQYTGNGSDTSSTTNFSLTGNWKTMPIGSKLSYRLTSKSVSSNFGSYGGTEQLTTCTVEKQVKAATLHPSLSGDAKVILCQTVPDQYHRVETTFFLQDYGVFFSQGTSKNSFFYSDEKISDVR